MQLQAWMYRKAYLRSCPIRICCHSVPATFAKEGLQVQPSSTGCQCSAEPLGDEDPLCTISDKLHMIVPLSVSLCLQAAAQAAPKYCETLRTMWSMSFLGGTVGMPSKGNSMVAISSNTFACVKLHRDQTYTYVSVTNSDLVTTAQFCSCHQSCSSAVQY